MQKIGDPRCIPMDLTVLNDNAWQLQILRIKLCYDTREMIDRRFLILVLVIVSTNN